MARALAALQRLIGDRGLNIGASGVPFQQDYVCHSVSSVDKSHLECGDKVILPPAALRRLASSDVQYPMLFELKNPATYCTEHCGVQEFVAGEGNVFVPYWIMENLLLEEGDIVSVKTVNLPKGTYVKLRPHQKGFLTVEDPEAVLKSVLSKFSCLTVGHSILVSYDNKEFNVDIIEAKPAAAICIIETDCEVEIVPPISDHRHQQQGKKKSEQVTKHLGKIELGTQPKLPMQSSMSSYVDIEPPVVPNTKQMPLAVPHRDPHLGSSSAPGSKRPTESAFTPFTGVSRRLNDEVTSVGKERSTKKTTKQGSNTNLGWK